MLADNIVYLRENYPRVYQVVKAWEQEKIEPSVIRELAKDGNMTLKVKKNGKVLYLHSKYNPLREAEAIIDKLSEKQDINEHTHLVFYGIGLGYHIENFIQRYPRVTYSIVEPSPEIMTHFLENKTIKRNRYKNLLLFQCGNQVGDLFEKAIQLKDKSLVICELPAYPTIYKEEYQNFLDHFMNIVKEQRSALHTNFAFKQRWVLNSVNNFKFVLKTANILLEKPGAFKEKNAILVAAGPSLDLEINNLKKIKEEGLAYIFSVGSAINTLTHHNIVPDGICTYDPSEKNQIVFNKINELGIDTIPMIFGSSVGYEVLEQYSGPKYHMITNQDTVSSYFLRPENGEIIEMVNDAPTISVVTLELLVKLNFSRVIMVGQNLAYSEEKIYSSAIDYITEGMREKIIRADGVFTESVDGNQIKTSESYLNMKRQLEHTIEKYKAKVINTTIGGAKIEGTTFKTLEKLINEDLVDACVRDYPLNRIEKTKKYDREYAIARMDRLVGEYKTYQNLILEIKNSLFDLQELTKMKQESSAQQTHLKMDEKIKKMEENSFFKMIASPINRVEYGMLCTEIEKIKAEKKHSNKIKSILKPTEVFINLLYADMDLNNNIMVVLKNTIKEFA